MALKRSQNDRVFLGVCGGLAENFGITSMAMRLIFVIFALCAGSGLIVYLVVALIMELS